ncbi:MAG: hypothetical protein C4520_14565 [Candidatus Abyssobacteria bacterium SURF_5]|uniref:Uncharacterized protein n=1 Tax=Abyssobacteria bacterium (strain SURF_5) TaxID=2093360 RepID=A0A3A4NA29_ABYX5|nr:MAG: hypothetical protein C4520_14565 [Candidatus Abyssubacteria bacterium SURF_5]
MGYRYPMNAWEMKIKNLEDELYKARIAIIRLMPERIQSILSSFYSCESRQESIAWEHNVIEQLIGFATILSREEGSYLSDRAYCPLCGDGSSSAYERGFTVPEGLRRHLGGWGNVRQCDVMVAAERLSREHFHETFHEAEERDRQEVLRLTQERKKTEILYLIGPMEDPRLIDESLWYDKVPRDPASIAWAEQRLKDLGFSIATDDNVRQYVLDLEDHVVFADPRIEGQITFNVYRKPLPRRKGHRRLYQSFYIRDNWKNDLQGKFETRLERAKT